MSDDELITKRRRLENDEDTTDLAAPQHTLASPVSNSEVQENENDEEEEEFIGPQPVSNEAEVETLKRKKVLLHEQVYLDSLPNAEYYEKSFMHREPITHIAVTKTDFIITASIDGHIKFWKKQESGIEFVKHFRTHLGNVQDISVNSTGTLLASISNDKSLKVFDVVNFDMINMLKLDFTPQACEWIHRSGDAIPALAVSDADSNTIYIFDGKGTKEPLKTLDNIHKHPVTIICYNPIFDAVISVDTSGMLEYWTGPKNDYGFPKNLLFDSKLDTDLFEFVSNKLTVCCLTISPNGKHFATLTSDRKICLFKFRSGKLVRVFDEELSNILEHQSKAQLVPSMEFGRRLAVERDLEKNNFLKSTNMTFDESSNFLLYPTVLGIKIVNIVTNKLVRLIGKPENLRILQIALFQGKPKKSLGVPTIEMEAADNPTLDSSLPDPTLFCTAYKKNRFYLFSRRDASKSDQDRDVFNEKPTKEDIISATDSISVQKIHDAAVIHTTKGDIHIKIFTKECPKTAENFCVNAKNGYFNGNIFHRVIKGFMIQTGDPSGIGTGGESIWGGEFEDEFHPSLRHDRPYTLSMANAGPNTNGSQFFITTTPTIWLDNKHTVFGRVVRGMETVQTISLVKTNPKTDKPYEDISIINVSLK